MIKKYKNVFRCIFVFFLFIFILFIINPSFNYGDGLWNYGFSYSITKGYLPYVDINMITPPFYAGICSIVMQIFGTGYHIFTLFNVFLVTIMFYYLFKMYDDKAWVFLAIISFFYFQIIQSTYNFFMLLLFVIIVYLEKKNSDDYLIGFILGLCILTKHTIGIFLILPSILYLKNDWKKVLKRFIGILIPCLFFLIYLLINGNFLEFLNLCILGLFDFASNNSHVLQPFTILWIIVCLFMIVYIFKNIMKDKSNIFNYYVLMTFSFAIPLFDAHHVGYFIFCFIVIYLENFNVSDKVLKIGSMLFSLIAMLYYSIFYIDVFNLTSFFDNSDLKYMYINKNIYFYLDKAIKKYSEYDNTIVIHKNPSSVIYNIYTNKDIGYFSVCLHGNFGYDSYKNLIKKINNIDNGVFFVYDSYYDLSEYNQYYVELAEYINKNYKKIDSIYDMGIYSKK